MDNDRHYNIHSHGGTEVANCNQDNITIYQDEIIDQSKNNYKSYPIANALSKPTLLKPLKIINNINMTINSIQNSHVKWDKMRSYT
jgi:hypothetical protein